ncbi:MAG TPA: xanthine dehydrogenase family protein molybdopterin-binding subunit [Xanthobacteraceae bacterium]|nr:xanthine dehydrogenase family protein molybdopterin-binding subunit [Xanthobacteraceae bacterium]
MDAHTSDHPHHGPTIRVEDDALVRGRGRFVDDDATENRAFAFFLRSPHAFARITKIDASAARDAPGVLAVLTAAEMKAAGVGNVSAHPPLPGRGGSKLVVPFRPALADERVMHVGQAIALVVATTQAAAQDAAEKVAVEYEELAPVVAAADAVKPGATQLWPEAPGNIALDWVGLAKEPDANAREVDAIIESAAHVARLTQLNQRIFPATMETRGATARYDEANDSYVLRCCSQSAQVMRDGVAPIMGLKREQLRVITEDVGGAFGLKTGAYPEYPALLVAAKHVGRPVHWMATRAEACLSDNQARDMLLEGELALDDKGKFLALRVRNLVNLGAFMGPVGAHLATNNFTRCFPGMYRIAHLDIQVRCAFTNTIPTAPFRGAGRPEANYILERLVDEAARLTGIDRDKIRRRNLIAPKEIPFKTSVGTTYDSGDFPTVFDKALALADVAGFAKRKREAAKRGKRLGLGISCLLEHSGGTPTESAAITFTEDGRLTVVLGVHSTGQGHATVYKRLAAERLGIPADRVFVRQGDSALGVGNGASVGSRSTMTAGTALVRTVEALIEKGRKIAANVLEAGEQDIVYRDGAFAVTGTDRRVGLFELAREAQARHERGEIAENLDTRQTADTPQTFPNGCHIAEIEVDPATGETQVLSYTAVDDAGNIMDHTLIEGQVHGGVAQGLGQALLEHAVYDDDGQLVSGSFMDYGMPRATDMPAFRIADVIAPATTNPLGVKGAGEAGTTGSLAAIMNAIADAVPAAAHMDMPATPEKVWKACRADQ